MLARFSLVLLLWFCVSSWGQEVDYNRSEGLCSHGNRLTCCWGWRPRESGRCQPHCQQGCKHGVCVGPDRCKCHPGYTGKACNQDLNECGLKPRPCKHRCMNTLGSFKCFCQDGYTETKEGRCRNARTCFHANCQYGCEVMKGAVRCTCPSPGLRLSPDRRTCSDIDECVLAAGVCPRRRKCVNTFGSFLCKCHLGFRLTYINGRYSCIDKDPRPFCSLNPSSPKCRCSDGSCRAVLKVTLEPHRPRTTKTTTAKTTTPTTTAATAFPLTTSTSPTTVKTTTPITTTVASTTIETTNPTTVLTTTPITPSAPTTIPLTTARTTTPITPSAPTTIPLTTARTTTPITPSAPTTIPLTSARTTTPITPSAPTTIPLTSARTTTPITPSAAQPTETIATTTLDTFTTTTTSTSTTISLITSTTLSTILTTTTASTTTSTTTTPELETTIPTTTLTTTIPTTTPFTTISSTIPSTTNTASTPDTSTSVIITTEEPSTTTVNNRINKDVTHRQRGDVHIPRHPNHNHVLEFDIELGNTAEDNRDDPEVGVLRCSSDQGVCDWMSDRDGDLHWETAENPAGGRYLSVAELKAGQRSIRGARLAVPIVPPWSHGDLCFSFSHWLTGHHVGVLQLFIRKKGRDQRFSSALWTRTGGHGWRHTQVTLTTHSLEKVLLKAERRKGQRGQIAVDDVTLRRGAC